MDCLNGFVHISLVQNTPTHLSLYQGKANKQHLNSSGMTAKRLNRLGKFEKEES
jgi:hypothetical protein